MHAHEPRHSQVGCRARGCAALIGLLLFHLPSAFAAEEWKEEKGDHFIVYYKEDAAFAKDAERQAEVYYNRIADDLGYPRYSNFWQWDNRVKIYVHPTEEEFQHATGRPGWTKGVAYYDTKSIVTYAWSEGFLDALLPHEITHLIFRDFVGFKGEIPLWLDEGVAQWQETKKREAAREIAFYLVRSGKHYPLRELAGMDVRFSQDDETVQYFYMQSVSLVDYLIRKHGTSGFTVFCRALRDGKSLDAALKSAYPHSLPDLETLEARWVQDVSQNH
jgi:hypothetical protein